MRYACDSFARILRPYNIRVARERMFTLRRLHTNVKDKDEPEDRPGADQKRRVPGHLYQWDRWVNEQERATKKSDLNNNIADTT